MKTWESFLLTINQCVVQPLILVLFKFIRMVVMQLVSLENIIFSFKIIYVLGDHVDLLLVNNDIAYEIVQ